MPHLVRFPGSPMFALSGAGPLPPGFSSQPGEVLSRATVQRLGEAAREQARASGVSEEMIRGLVGIHAGGPGGQTDAELAAATDASLHLLEMVPNLQAASPAVSSLLAPLAGRPSLDPTPTPPHEGRPTHLDGVLGVVDEAASRLQGRPELALAAGAGVLGVAAGVAAFAASRRGAAKKRGRRRKRGPSARRGSTRRRKVGHASIGPKGPRHRHKGGTRSHRHKVVSFTTADGRKVRFKRRA